MAESAPAGPGEPGRDDAAHEAQCRRCGISCHVAVPLGSGRRQRLIAVPGLHCRYLQQDLDGRFGCSVYAERFALAPWCHHADVAGPLGYLAHDCPYGTPAGQGKIRLTENELQAVWPELLWVIEQGGVPNFVDRDALLAEVGRREGRQFVLVPDPRDPEQLLLRPARRPK